MQSHCAIKCKYPRLLGRGEAVVGAFVPSTVVTVGRKISIWLVFSLTVVGDNQARNPGLLKGMLDLIFSNTSTHPCVCVCVFTGECLYVDAKTQPVQWVRTGGSRTAAMTHCRSAQWGCPQGPRCPLHRHCANHPESGAAMGTTHPSTVRGV